MNQIPYLKRWEAAKLQFRYWLHLKAKSPQSLVHPRTDYIINGMICYLNEIKCYGNEQPRDLF